MPGARYARRAKLRVGAGLAATPHPTATEKEERLAGSSTSRAGTAESRPDSILPHYRGSSKFGLKVPLALASGHAAAAGGIGRSAASSGTTFTRDMAAAKPRTQPQAA